MYQLFNILLAFWPAIWFGLYDKCASPRRLYENKDLYRSYHYGHENGINFKKYIIFNGKAILVSFINFYIMYAVYDIDSRACRHSGVTLQTARCMIYSTTVPS